MEAQQLNSWGMPSIRLDFFSGPMDLLLHLVQQREVSIEDVDLADVCNQYLEIVSQAQLIDLEQATEYLVIAATLLAMKCEALLPSGEEADADDLEGYDPRFFKELRERLLAYAETKARGRVLTARPQLGFDEFTTPPRHDEREEGTMDVSGDGLTLGRVFAQLLKRIGAAGERFKIRMEPISVVSYMMKVVDRFTDLMQSARGIVSARRSFLDVVWMVGGASSRDRGVVVGSFIAILELMKRGVVSAEGDDSGENFSLEFKLHQLGKDRGGEVFVSEFDVEAKSDVSADFDGVEEVEVEKRVQHG